MDGWSRAGPGLNQKQACAAGGEQKLQLAGSADAASGHGKDGRNGKLETGAEVETRGAVGAKDGEAGLPAEIQIAEEECAGGVVGVRGNGLIPKTSSPSWRYRGCAG